MIKNFKEWSLNEETSWTKVANHVFKTDLPKGDTEELRKHTSDKNETWETKGCLAVIYHHNVGHNGTDRGHTEDDHFIKVINKSGYESFDTWMTTAEIAKYLRPITDIDRANKKFGI